MSKQPAPENGVVVVTISGKAWRAEPIGGDPCYVPDTEDLRRVQASAVVTKCGRGERVTLRAGVDDLLRLAEVYETVGESALTGCDSPGHRSEARAVLEAARIIKERVAQSIGQPQGV